MSNPSHNVQNRSPSRLSGRPASRFSSTLNDQLLDGPPEEAVDDEDGLALPVEPDEGTALIPDDDRVVNVPS